MFTFSLLSLRTARPFPLSLHLRMASWLLERVLGGGRAAGLLLDAHGNRSGKDG